MGWCARSGRSRLVAATLALLVSAAMLAGCAIIDAASAAPPPATPGTAAAALAQLAVKGRAPATGYDRKQFGQAWRDIDRNGCDQRNDVLARDLVNETFKRGTNDCVVLTGTLQDPYSGRIITFKRGATTSDDVQIDHVVALSDAWRTGAWQLAPATRELLANNPLNLLATAGPINQAKGDSNAASWLPPDRAAWCPYVARQVAVKLAYGLWVTPPEHDAMARVLARCPDQPLPAQAVPTPETP